jgi:23S rRNA (uracil1939-C5)-methyltransferase
VTIVTITALGARGEGIAEVEGRRVYVPFTLPGERVEITVEGERGRLADVIEPSPARAAPFCPHFGRCGGCQLQHLAPEAYAAFKRNLVVTALNHAGIEAEIAPLADGRGTGRRRTTLHMRGRAAGFMGFHSHALENLDRCPILVPALAKAPDIARAVQAVAGDGDVSFTATLTGIDLDVKPRRRTRPERLTPLFAPLGLARLSLNGEPLLLARAPVLRVGTALVELPTQGFLQATEAAEAILAQLVAEALDGAKVIADLFCGIGPFALRLAASARIFAADSDRAAVAALDKAARNTRGLRPIETKRRDLFREPLSAVELARFDALVFDPPRAGAEAQARDIAQSKVPVVVAVSCEPKTFARDAKILIDGGYKPVRVTPVDQFAFSTHVELVGVFRR